MRFGAVFRNRKTYGAVRCGFSDVVNPTVRYGLDGISTVRFGAVFRYRRTYGAVSKRAQLQRCGAVRLTASNRTEPHRTVRKKTQREKPCFLYTVLALYEVLRSSYY